MIPKGINTIPTIDSFSWGVVEVAEVSDVACPEELLLPVPLLLLLFSIQRHLSVFEHVPVFGILGGA